MTVNEPLTTTTGVNDSLSPPENRDSSAFAPLARRVMVQWASEVAASDPSALSEFVDFADEISDAIALAIKAMREANGFSWADIAAPLGISRQAAQQRWGVKCRDVT